MTNIRITPMPTEHAEALWQGGLDANGMPPERYISDGKGVPCRHCLTQVAAGKPYLALAYRPFSKLQPYAEVGPVFLCAEPCQPHQDDGHVPAHYFGGEPRIVRGYGADDRILYDTGKVLPVAEIEDYAADLLARPETAYVHVRSSMNNCYAFRIDRAGD